MKPRTYYVVQSGYPNRYDLRQTRFKGCVPEHPHDLMAVGFSPEAMRKLVAEFFPDTDLSALEKEP